VFGAMIHASGENGDLLFAEHSVTHRDLVIWRHTRTRAPTIA